MRQGRLQTQYCRSRCLDDYAEGSNGDQRRIEKVQDFMLGLLTEPDPGRQRLGEIFGGHFSRKTSRADLNHAFTTFHNSNLQVIAAELRESGQFWMVRLFLIASWRSQLWMEAPYNASLNRRFNIEQCRKRGGPLDPPLDMWPMSVPFFDQETAPTIASRLA